MSCEMKLLIVDLFITVQFLFPLCFILRSLIESHTMPITWVSNSVPKQLTQVRAHLFVQIHVIHI